MITASFFKSGNDFLGFEVAGHADYGDFGNDIVCAGVSSAVMLTANAVTDGFGIKADAQAEGETVRLRLSAADENATRLISALKNHLELLSSQYKGTIKIVNLEV
ncbi:MAG: ribosomal-processing cysteine protease Prp [Oscillospiraceae bacterium]